VRAATLNNTSDTNTVTGSLRNSHCIICGTPFNTAYAGKIYCSNKCKQFGCNHKEQLFQSKNISGIGINAKPQTFYIEDFQFYDKMQKMLFHSQFIYMYILML
jgi:predicted nucleic acid-binding Zn ribbon protein